MKRTLIRNTVFAVTSLVAVAFPSLAAVSPAWDLATVRRQADRAADWQLAHPVTTGRFVHQHTPLYWTMGAFYNGLLDWGLSNPDSGRFADHVRRVGAEVGWDRQRKDGLVLGHADTHCVCAAWLQLAAEDNVLGERIRAAKELMTWIVRRSYPKCPSVAVTGGKTYEPNREVRFKKGVVAAGGRVWDVRYGREVAGTVDAAGDFVFKINVLAGQRREFLVLTRFADGLSWVRVPHL